MCHGGSQDPDRVRGAGQGLWRAAIYNPMHIYKISYNLTVSRAAACLNNCSQHGTCSADGLCHCQGDWCCPLRPLAMPATLWLEYQ